MRKIGPIVCAGILSLTTYGCSVAVSPPNNQPTIPTTQAAQPPAKPDRTEAKESNPPNKLDRDLAISDTEPVATKPISSTENSTKRSSSVSLAQPALADVTGSRQDRSWETQGTASTGETVMLSFNSIQVAMRSLGQTQPPSYFFQYRIGGDRIYAMTACNGEFSTSPDGDRYDTPRRPESAATQKMLDRVCSGLVRSAQVFSPPSNVRMEPEGKIICTLTSNQSITTYGEYKDWLYTNACGNLGLIHSSQVR